MTIKTALVTPELPTQTGGIGTFIWNFAKLLRGSGHHVHIILANETDKPREHWIAPFAEMGIQVSYLFETPVAVPPGSTWHQELAARTSRLIPADTDIVYFADWQAKGIDFVRNLRFTRERRPVTVTVCHGPTKWIREGMREYPKDIDQLWLDFAEGYVLKHSDFVVAPGSYMQEWVSEHFAEVPPIERRRVLNLPFFPPERSTAGVSVSDLPPASPARFRRIVYFGRLETRKGIGLFVEGLGKLHESPALDGIEEVVFLGGNSKNPFGSAVDVIKALGARLGTSVAVPRTARQVRPERDASKTNVLLDATPDHMAAVRTKRGTRITIKAITHLNTFQAQDYLARHAAECLVVIPSLRENFPLAVIETSLIPHLTILCSDAGSIGEILGPKGEDQLFSPHLASFAARLEQTLLAGPRKPEDLAHYDWVAANRSWLAFHDEMTRVAAERRAHQAVEEVSQAAISGMPTVDVCIPYYNLGEYLPFMLESLTRQTAQDFGVVVVNDGSTDQASIETFEQMRTRYQSRGWRFLTTPNAGPSAARNAAAANSKAEYLIFLDADDVAAPTLVERFVNAIVASGDDCLSCYFHLFRGKGWQSAYADSSFYYYTPAGSDLLLGLLSNPFGGAGFIVSRRAFDAIGGFTTRASKFAGHEDYELFVRLRFAGFAQDVVPDYLVYYRIRDEGRFRTTDLFDNMAPVVDIYERHLKQIGLDGLASLALGLVERTTDVPYLVNQVSGHVVWRVMRTKLRNQIARRLGRRPH